MTKTVFNIIDAPTGAGKTTALIHMLKQEQDKITTSNNRYIVITPLLTEVNRIASQTGFSEPSDTDSSKQVSLKRLLAEGRNICCTHKLCDLFSSDTLALLDNGIYNYTLVIDEEPNVITACTDTTDKDNELAPKDYRKAVTDGIITCNETTGQIEWVKGSTYDTEETDRGYLDKKIKQRLAVVDIYSINDHSCIVELIKGNLWEHFCSVWVSSYRVESSLFHCYCQLHGFPLNYFHIDGINISNGYKALKPAELNRLAICEDLRYVFGKPLRNQKPLSFTWCQKNLIDAKGRPTATAKDLTRRFRNYIRTVTKTSKTDSLVWTAYSAYQQALSARELSQKRWLAYNTRATNDYQNCTTVGFLCDRYPNSNLLTFFNTFGIKIDRDAFALSTLIQFIWRSNIRDSHSDKTIHLFIPSYRMRQLFAVWLNK